MLSLVEAVSAKSFVKQRNTRFLPDPIGLIISLQLKLALLDGIKVCR